MKAAELERTCVGCRRRAHPDDLVRVARGRSGDLGTGRRAQGRGAWVCAGSHECLDRALARGSLARALRRGPFTNDEQSMLRAKLLST